MASGTITPEHTHKVMDGRTNSMVSAHKSLKSASRAADRRDNEYGGHRYRVERIQHPALPKHNESHAADLNAHANLLREQRLAAKSARQTEIGEQAAKLESKMPKTQESLGHLGAGKRYGE